MPAEGGRGGDKGGGGLLPSLEVYSTVVMR
jgi:hypothetical protein